MGVYKWTIFDRALGGSPYLDDNDICLFYMHKTDGRPSDSEPNQLVYNLKINPAKMTDGQRRGRFKEKAINRCAEDMAGYLNQWKAVTPLNTVLVPVPPSKPPEVPGYDDRMALVCSQIQGRTGIRCIDCLSTKKDLGAMHHGSLARDIKQLRDNIAFAPEMIPSGTQYVILVDDQLTKGTHFKAIKPMFTGYGYVVIGMFWAKEHFKGADPAW